MSMLFPSILDNLKIGRSLEKKCTAEMKKRLLTWYVVVPQAVFTFPYRSNDNNVPCALQFLGYWKSHPEIWRITFRPKNLIQPHLPVKNHTPTSANNLEASVTNLPTTSVKEAYTHMYVCMCRKKLFITSVKNISTTQNLTTTPTPVYARWQQFSIFDAATTTVLLYPFERQKNKAIQHSWKR